jgi:hypothetical protein
MSAVGRSASPGTSHARDSPSLFASETDGARAPRARSELSYQAANEVLWGRWDGQYSDGKEPGFWRSTVDIVSQWYDSGNMVKYGQVRTASPAPALPRRPPPPPPLN